MCCFFTRPVRNHCSPIVILLHYSCSSQLLTFLPNFTMEKPSPRMSAPPRMSEIPIIEVPKPPVRAATIRTRKAKDEIFFRISAIPVPPEPEPELPPRCYSPSVYSQTTNASKYQKPMQTERNYKATSEKSFAAQSEKRYHTSIVSPQPGAHPLYPHFKALPPRPAPPIPACKPTSPVSPVSSWDEESRYDKWDSRSRKSKKKNPMVTFCGYRMRRTRLCVVIGMIVGVIVVGITIGAGVGVSMARRYQDL